MIKDYFAVLGAPRRPWLDAESLKEKFFALSAEVHSDRVHRLAAAEKQKAQDRYTELNAAYNCLRETKTRLRHLIELERGAAPKDVQTVPRELIEAFMEIGSTFRQVDAFITEKNRATSPILKVSLLERGDEWTEKLRALQTRLIAHRDALSEQLKSVDSAWISAPEQRFTLLPPIEKFFHLFGYFDRWIAQLQERVHQIAF